MSAKQVKNGTWWQDGDQPDEAPGMRVVYDAEFTVVPKQRPYVPSRRDILKRGDHV